MHTQAVVLTEHRSQKEGMQDKGAQLLPCASCTTACAVKHILSADSFALVLFAFVPAASGLLSLPPFDRLLLLI